MVFGVITIQFFKRKLTLFPFHKNQINQETNWSIMTVFKRVISKFSLVFDKVPSMKHMSNYFTFYMH